MKNYITTYSKIHFMVDEPKMDDISIQDIAHALSMITRANGHFPKFYSVAQHSLHCALEAVERNYSANVAMALLLHDASEAYLCDITRPIKQHLDYYLKKEKQVQQMIYDKFLEEPLTEEEKQVVSAIDDAMLFNEFKYYMSEELDLEHRELVTRPVFITKSFDDVEDEFISTFYKLKSIIDS